MKLILIRTYGSQGINGNLLLEGKEICKTIELPWKNNEKRISAIPEGTYQVSKRYSKKFDWHLEITGVRGRSLILFHPANNALKELNGCIAPVSYHTGEGKGAASRTAFERLKASVFPLLEWGFTVLLTIQSDRHENHY